MINKLDDILSEVKGNKKVVLSVSAAHDKEVLLSIKEAVQREIVTPILIGDKNKIEQISAEIKFNLDNIRIIQKDNVFEIVDKEMLKIDKRGELLILDNTILVRNVKVLQDFFGFQVFVRNQAQSVISKLEELDIIGNIATLKEYQTGEKLTISKKLMKVKNSPVLAMDKDELINKIPLVPRYKNIIHIENGKIRTNTKKDVDNLMKLLNDDYVKSELTDMEYDSTSKTLLNSESQDE